MRGLHRLRRSRAPIGGDMYALASTEAIYRYAGLKTQAALLGVMTHHWAFASLTMFVMAWRIMRTGFLVPFQAARANWLSGRTRDASVMALAISIGSSCALLAALR